MHYFFSVGDPSGDIHGSNLMAELRRCDPDAHFSGFGGDRMRTGGAELLYPLAEEPVIGLSAVIMQLPKFFRLADQAKKFLADQRPDAVILIDYPGFNWHIARIAKDLGIPVHYYVPPQIWAWADWRISRIKDYVDYAWCSLPFEEEWYHQRGYANARYVGHPFFDDIATRQLNEGFIESQRHRDLRQIVALLPGSRTQEVKRNFPGMLRAARKIVRDVPQVRFVVAGFRERHLPIMEAALDKVDKNRKLPLEIQFGRTPEIMQLADATIAASGSVSIELMYYRAPTTVVYYLSPFIQHFVRNLMQKCKFFSLVNLIAGHELYPEFLGYWDQSTAVAQHTTRLLTDLEYRQQVMGELTELKQAYAESGASRTTAQLITEQLSGRGLPENVPTRKAG